MILYFLLISVMPLLRHPFWSGFVGDLTMIKYLGTICFLYALLYLLSRRRQCRFLGTPQAWCFLALTGLAMTSFLMKGAPVALGESPLMAYISFLGLFVTTLVLVDSPHRLRQVLLAAVASNAIASLYVMREWQNMGFADTVRPGWVTGDPNYFSVSAVLFLPAAFCLARESRSSLQRVFCLGSLGLTLLALTAAASRGGFLGLTGATIFLAWRLTRTLTKPALVFVGLLVLSLLSPSSSIDRFINPVKGDVQAEEQRLLLWEAGVRALADNPLTGMGAGNFKYVISRYFADPNSRAMVAHNTYVETAAELGLPGLLILLGVFVSTFASLEGVRRRTSFKHMGSLHSAAMAMQAGLIGYAISAFFVSVPWQKFFWLTIFLSISLRELEVVETRRKIRGPTPRCINGPTQA